MPPRTVDRAPDRGRHAPVSQVSRSASRRTTPLRCDNRSRSRPILQVLFTDCALTLLGRWRMLCDMKKLAILIATTSLAIATPVFACPHEDAAAPKTAEKTKDEKGTTDKAKEQPKKDEGTATTAKKKEEPKQDTTKKADKVSQK
jgi:hypothetical protein